MCLMNGVCQQISGKFSEWNCARSDTQRFDSPRPVRLVCNKWRDNRRDSCAKTGTGCARASVVNDRTQVKKVALSRAAGCAFISCQHPASLRYIESHSVRAAVPNLYVPMPASITDAESLIDIVSALAVRRRQFLSDLLKTLDLETDVMYSRPSFV